MGILPQPAPMRPDGPPMLAYSLPGAPDIGPVPEASWKISDLFPVFFSAEGLAVILVTVGRRWFYIPYGDIYAFGAILSELCLFASVLFWLRIVRPSPLSVFGRSQSLARDIGLGILVGIGLLIVSVVVIGVVSALWRAVMGHQPATGGSTQLGSTWEVVVTGVGMVIAAPLAEELFFRGFVYGALRNRFPVKYAALMSAVLFGFAHIYPVKMVGMFVAGLLLANLYETRGNLVPSMVAHMTNNLVAFLAILANAHRL